MKLKIKDPGSALTHFIAMISAIIATAPLLLRAADAPGHLHVLFLSSA